MKIITKKMPKTLYFGRAKNWVNGGGFFCSDDTIENGRPLFNGEPDIIEINFNFSFFLRKGESQGSSFGFDANGGKEYIAFNIDFDSNNMSDFKKGIIQKYIDREFYNDSFHAGRFNFCPEFSELQ